MHLHKQTSKINVKDFRAPWQLYIKLYTKTSVAIGHVKDKLEINISETYSVRMYNLWSLSSENMYKVL